MRYARLVLAGSFILTAAAGGAQPLTDPCAAQASLAVTAPGHPMVARLGGVCEAIGPRLVTPSCLNYYFLALDPALPAPPGGRDALSTACETEMRDGTDMMGWRERWIGFTATEAAAEAMFYQAEWMLSDAEEQRGPDNGRSLALARHLFRRAADLGNPVAWIALGDMAEYGTGQPVNKVLAMGFFLRAWEGGISEGAYRAMQMADQASNDRVLFETFADYYRYSPADALEKLEALGERAVSTAKRQLMQAGGYGGPAEGGIDASFTGALDTFLAAR
jgi:hypothetical protein